MRKLASIIAMGGLTTAVACGDDGITGVSTTGGEDDSTSSTGVGPGLTTAVTTPDDTADSTGDSTGGSTGDSGADTSTGEPPADSSSSGGPQTCGNGTIDAGETCDGDELDAETCEGLGLGAGTLACAADCSDFDTSGCGPAPSCGDGVIDDGEACDGDALGGRTCESQSFDAGTLACTAECELDTTGCVLFSCGNGAIEGKEACDGDALGGATCAGLGFGAGEVACTAQCGLDTSGCCGDGALGGAEECDDTDLGGQTCGGLGFPGGTLSCAADCTLDDAGCSVCGDGSIGDGEVCDGADLAGADCVSIGMGFFGGTLACAPTTCQYDTSGCNLCGNGAVDAGEACDGAELSGATCASLGLGFTGGTLSCAAACDYDTSACTSFPVPGTGDVVVSEIMYDPNVVLDSAGEWFELHNPGATDTLELQGCTIESNNASEAFSIDVPLTIAPGGYLTFAKSGDPTVIGFTPDFVLPAGFSLANGGDLVRLSCGGTLVDEVTYDDIAPWPDPPAGQSLNLDPDTLDATLNDGGAAWCAGTNDFFMGELGTPGAANTDCVAVPTWAIGFCRLQFPLSIADTAGAAVTVYGRVYAAGLTDQSTAVDPDAQLLGQVGFGPDASDPSADPTTWTWFNASPNAGWDGTAAGEPNNDEYEAALIVPAPPPTDRDYAYRFSGDGGATWTYCDGDNGGSTTGYAPADAGQLTSNAAPIPELWFSEYVEGSGNNKAIEIYNGGTSDASLDACTISQYFNGNVTSTDLALSGTLAAGDTFVFCNSGIVDTSFCDALGGLNFNGNDAVALVCSATTLDVIGQIGVDPGAEWSGSGVGTQDETIQRQCTVAAGDPDGSDAFDPSLEWSTFPQDTFTDLGTYTCP